MLVILIILFWTVGTLYVISQDWSSFHDVSWFDIINWTLMTIFLPCIAIFFIIDMVISPLQYNDKFSQPIFPKKKEKKND